MNPRRWLSHLYWPHESSGYNSCLILDHKGINIEWTVVICLYHSQMRSLWMQSSWTCTKTVMESSWCLTSPSSGKTHLSKQLHYSWTDDLSVCRFPLGVVSIAAPPEWTLPVSSLCASKMRRSITEKHCVKFANHFSDELTHIFSFLYLGILQEKKNSIYLSL